jgi:hypothetical protein
MDILTHGGHLSGTRALHWQVAVVVMLFAVVALVPQPGSGTLLIPIRQEAREPALDWALGHGATIMGNGPVGGVLLIGVQPEFGWHALYEGALAIRVPKSLCENASK